MQTRDEKTLLLDEKIKKGAHFESSIIIVEGENQTIESSNSVKITRKESREETKTRLFSSACILITELCERLTYYSITANLVLFLTSYLAFTSPDADTIATVFTGTSFFAPIFGGLLADSVAGKFNAIYGSGLIYLIGVFLLVAASISYPRVLGHGYNLNMTYRTVYYISGLVFVAIGAGGIKANVSPYGAAQVEQAGGKAIQTFFLWFYWFINLGGFISFIGVAYLQQNISFAIGYIIPFAAVLLSITVFQLGRNAYKNSPPSGSVITTAVSAITQGIKRRHNVKPPCSFIDAAKTTHGGSHSIETVEGVKDIAKIIPIFASLIIYWSIYAQLSTTFFTQTLRLDVRIGSFVPPAASLNLFDIIIVLGLIPIMDRIIYPILRRKNKQPTLLQRIGIGFCISFMSMIAAGVLEIYRKKDLLISGPTYQVIGGDEYEAASLTMFAQIPQFTLIGASEVFTSIASLEFAYSESPSSMKGLVMGLSLMMTGLGSYLSSILILIVRAIPVTRHWFPDNINDGNLEYFFFLLAILMFINIVIYLWIASHYTYAECRLRSRSSSYTTSDASTTPTSTETKPSLSEFPSDKSEFTHL